MRAFPHKGLSVARQVQNGPKFRGMCRACSWVIHDPTLGPKTAQSGFRVSGLGFGLFK